MEDAETCTYSQDDTYLLFLAKGGMISVLTQRGERVTSIFCRTGQGYLAGEREANHRHRSYRKPEQIRLLRHDALLAICFLYLHYYFLFY